MYKEEHLENVNSYKYRGGGGEINSPGSFKLAIANKTQKAQRAIHMVK